MKTEKELEAYLREVAKDIIADGFSLDECAGDIADSLYYTPELRMYVLKTHPFIKTKTQWREFITDRLVG